MEGFDVDLDDVIGGSGNKLTTKLPGIEVETDLVNASPEELEAVHRRQLEWALEHAEESKNASRM